MKEHITSIRTKLAAMILITAAIVLLITSLAFSIYEYVTFKKAMVRELSSISEIIAENSMAALAFEDSTSARQVLGTLKAEKQIVGARITDASGNLFAGYPGNQFPIELPDSITTRPQFVFTDSHLLGVQDISMGSRHLGTLYVVSTMSAIYQRLQVYALVTMLVVALSFFIVYLLSKILQRQVSTPILSLAETARAIAHRRDYSVRASRHSNDELGLLTDAFNQMLSEIQNQNGELIGNQKKISQLNQELEERVEERTRELANANKELESFSYSVSHDLRAPLRSIHGYINIFDEEYASKLDDEARRIMSIIVSNAGKMGRLIDDLLEFSRLGRAQLAFSHFSMKELVVEVFEQCKTAHDKSEIRMTIDELPTCYADWTTMKHVWQNLIMNALKYSSHRPESIIHVGSESSGEGVIYFIRDNGAGFDMAYYDKLFGVFQRLHSSAQFEGTGVGLAIVHRIIQKHNGQIWAEAKIDQGATFYFSLP